MSQQLSVNLVSDPEWSGGLNRATGEGHKFALMLAMLQQNVLRRPRLHADEESDFADTLQALKVYPVAPLATDEDCWQRLKTDKSLLHQDPANERLWQCMHPHPLSLYNDAKRLSDEVVFNCDYHTQVRLKAASEGSPEPDSLIEVDETGLYDVLQSLNQDEALFA